MTHWLTQLAPLLADGHDVIRVVVTATRGSAPRDAGATLLVHARGTHGTLGGGHLEFQAIELARDMLLHASAARSQRFSLGAALGQCCGGVVELSWERYTAHDRALVADALQRQQSGGALLLTRLDGTASGQRQLHALDDAAFATLQPTQRLQRDDGDWLVERLESRNTPLWLFGAGHVGQAVVRVLTDLPFNLTWLDSRPAVLPATLPGVTLIETELPADAVRHAPTDAWFLVFTHDHDLDLDICRAILTHGGTGFVGLIGSRTKAARFRHRLDAQGLPAGRITCPIGISGISGKEPASIALAVAAQLLQLREAQAQALTSRAAS
jgi:xanthine dehydrogenase accessory factor